MSESTPEQPARPTFDPTAEHQTKPKLRRIRGFPLPVQGPDGKQAVMLGLADAQQISEKMVATTPAAQTILPLMDGTRSVDDLVGEIGRGLTREFLEPFVAQLDEAGLIEGPAFDAMFAEMKEKFDESDMLPPGVTAQFADQVVAARAKQEETELSDEERAERAPVELRKALDAWIEQTLSAEGAAGPFENMPRAVVAPHIDYPRGWMNYANIYGRIRGLDAPDRVVVLGTNHFGTATGVCGCDKGFETPIGTSPLDDGLVSALKEELGEDASAKLFEHRFDHEREHSIELHLPWIQHCVGDGVPVFAALIHDPTVNSGESYDGNGLALDPFVEALKRSLEKVGGRTLIVSSADLSHMGPAFGDQQAMAGEGEEVQSARERVASHDREMLQHVIQNKPDDLIASMTWQQNPTRWCSIGNLTATLRLVEPGEVKQFGYVAAVDQQGTALVSHAALALH